MIVIYRDLYNKVFIEEVASLTLSPNQIRILYPDSESKDIVIYWNNTDAEKHLLEQAKSNSINLIPLQGKQ